MGYWGKVAHRAWGDTKPWLGLSEPRVNARRFMATLAVGGGVGGALIAGDRIDRQNWYWAFVFAFVVFALLLLLWNFLRAPDRMHREADAVIQQLSARSAKRGTNQQEIDALQGAYAVGRELLRMKDTLAADEMKPRVNEWFSGTAELVKRVGSRNEAFTFATAADFAAVPAGDRAPSALLLTRLANLKHIIERLVQQHEGAPKVPGAKRPQPQDE